MKTINTAATKPGIESGSVTRNKVESLLSPRSWDASKSERSIYSKATKIGRIAKGAKAWASVIITAFTL